MIQGRSLKIALAAAWALVVVLLLALGFWIVRESVLVPDQSLPLAPRAAPEKTEGREIKLYFSDEAAGALVAETRRVELSDNIPSNAARIIDELVKGPQSSGLQPTIPPGTRLLDSYYFDNTLVLDFSIELQANHSGGSAGELLTVYSIVNTMTGNLPGVARVKIMLEGNEIESLAGHLDLTKPLSMDTRWMSPSRPLTYRRPNRTPGLNEIS
ncbi:MAG: hypothetical protein Kow0099_10970 [Candidatus Abyssubacteria bacterium]